jgi:antitoxin component of RelBE/YafQ-DinJ toxin-antitoxin module
MSTTPPKRTVLQIPMSPELRKRATTAAKEQGFSSLQEMVRLFVERIARAEVSVQFSVLSEKSAHRYQAMDEDFSKNKDVKDAESMEVFIKALHEDRVS